MSTELSTAAPTIATEPEVSTFKTDGAEFEDESGLRKVLLSQRDTRPVLIRREEDALLGRDALIQNKFQFTFPALYQFCSALSPGLFKVIVNLCGEDKRSQKYSGESYSLPQAIGVLNEMIRARFGMLDNKCSFIIDQRNLKIEGMVGPRYEFLSNFDFYETIRGFMASNSVCEFHEAILTGRRLQLFYRNSSHVFALPTPLGKMEPYYHGRYLTNSELGDCCIKGAALLYRRWSQTSSMCPFTNDTKLIHRQGRGFQDKFRNVLGAIGVQVEALRHYEGRMESLKTMSVELGATDKVKREHRKKNISILVKNGVSRRLAEDILAHAFVHGSYKNEKMQIPGKNDDSSTKESAESENRYGLPQRSVFDVYNASCYLAQHAASTPAGRERLEQIAFRLLTGDISLIFNDTGGQDG